VDVAHDTFASAAQKLQNAEERQGKAENDALIVFNDDVVVVYEEGVLVKGSFVTVIMGVFV